MAGFAGASAAISTTNQMASGFLNRSFAKKEARKDRAFQERMSSTAYQRVMLDMRAAGLNPILAYKTGGASQPSGSTAAQANFDLSGIAGTALKGAKISEELKTLRQSRLESMAREKSAYSAAGLADEQTHTARKLGNKHAVETQLLSDKLPASSKDKSIMQNPYSGWPMRGVNKLMRVITGRD